MEYKFGDVFSKNGIYYYVTSVGDNIDSIAKKTGVDKTIIRELNGELEKKRRINCGTLVKISNKDYKTDPIINIGAKMVKAAENNIQNDNNDKADSRAKSNSVSKSNADKIKAQEEKKRQNELKKNQYLENIKNAQADYETSIKEENDRFSEQNAKLDMGYKNDSNDLESDMAKQKITESSIAENETKKLITDYENSKKQLSDDLESKIEKLKNKLQRKVESETNKINALS